MSVKSSENFHCKEHKIIFVATVSCKNVVDNKFVDSFYRL